MRKVITLFTVNINSIKRMNIDLAGSRVAWEIEEVLLKRINQFIEKRDRLLANMNHYSLQRLSQLIEEINEQLVITTNKSSISQIQDLINIRTDNFMSISDSKMINQKSPKQVYDDSPSKKSSLKNGDIDRKRRNSIIMRQASSLDLEQKRSKTEKKSVLSHCISLTERQEEEESRHVQMMRLAKIQEQKELAIKIAKENLAQEKKVVIDINGKRIMFDYDSKITKLEDIKPKQAQTLRKVVPTLPDQDYNYANISKKIDELNRINVRQVKQKINVTLKDINEENRKKGRGSFIPSKMKTVASQQPVEVVNSVIQINLESHKEIQEAIRVIQSGIKISVNRNDYSKPKNTPRKITSLIKKMTRSEYINFKAEEDRRGLIQKRENTHRTAVSQPKIVDPELKIQSNITKNTSTVADLQLQSSIRRVSLALERRTKSNDSKISIFNEQMRRDLINQTEKRVKFDDPPKESNNKIPMTNVEKYNLLYTKYQGLPPDSLVKQLQSESRLVQRATERRMTQFAAKKQTWVRQNRQFLQRAG